MHALTTHPASVPAEVIRKLIAAIRLDAVTAALAARSAEAREARDLAVLDDLPNHLRRDIGLPDLPPRPSTLHLQGW